MKKYLSFNFTANIAFIRATHVAFFTDITIIFTF